MRQQHYALLVALAGLHVLAVGLLLYLATLVPATDRGTLLWVSAWLCTSAGILLLLAAHARKELR